MLVIRSLGSVDLFFSASLNCSSCTIPLHKRRSTLRIWFAVRVISVEIKLLKCMFYYYIYMCMYGLCCAQWLCNNPHAVAHTLHSITAISGIKPRAYVLLLLLQVLQTALRKHPHTNAAQHTTDIHNYYYVVFAYAPENIASVRSSSTSSTLLSSSLLGAVLLSSSSLLARISMLSLVAAWQFSIHTTTHNAYRHTRPNRNTFVPSI